MGVSVAGLGLLADAVSAVQNFVHVFILVYLLLLFAYILSSWFQMPYRPWLYRIRQFLSDVCEPYLRLFRRVLPPLGPLDLSPIVAVFVLVVFDQLLIAVLDRLH
ncbi:MAG: YggT family protein [Actinobacteria bacterium]|nr:YggT family protein [Actinomycetota bacterium]